MNEMSRTVGPGRLHLELEKLYSKLGGWNPNALESPAKWGKKVLWMQR